ncbi:MAG: hypothetical protein ABI625_07105 [bacterium]
MMRPAVVGLVAVAGLAACGRGKTASDTAAASQQAATASNAPGTKPLCQRTGHWSECTVRIRLDQSGLAPQSGADKIGDLPEFNVKPLLFTVGISGVAVYLYPDTVSRHAAAASLDTSKFIPQSRPVSMKNETTLIQNDNVLVLLFSKIEHQRERVADAITAGAPQP